MEKLKKVESVEDVLQELSRTNRGEESYSLE
jgi:hypothetical protein